MLALTRSSTGTIVLCQPLKPMRIVCQHESVRMPPRLPRRSKQIPAPPGDDGENLNEHSVVQSMNGRLGIRNNCPCPGLCGSERSRHAADSSGTIWERHHRRRLIINDTRNDRSIDIMLIILEARRRLADIYFGTMNSELPLQ